MSAASPRSLSPAASPQQKAPGALRSGSRAAPLPTEAARGFATARSLVQSETPTLALNGDLAQIQKVFERQRAEGKENEPAKKPRKRITEPSAGGDAEEPPAKPKPKPRARKPKAHRDTHAQRAPTTAKSLSFADGAAPKAIGPQAERAAEPSAEPAAPTAPAAKPTRTRKSRARKINIDGDETQTTIKKSTKVRRKDTGSVSAHFRNHKDVEQVTNGAAQHSHTEQDSIWDVPLSPSNQSKKGGPPKQRPPDTNQSLDLDEAIIRRRDWTPPLENTTSSGVEISKGGGSFTNVLAAYSYAQLKLTSDTAMNPANTITPRTTTSDGPAAMKRRRIELVDVPANQVASRQSSPEKGKAPRKKARTITDIVTGQYNSNAPPMLDAQQSEVTSNFFASRTTSTITKVPLNDASESSTTKSAERSHKRAMSKPASESGETKVKSKSKKGSAKAAAKPKMVADKLLSPASAVLRMNKQDVLFGTSSQLALEESPTMVRQIQQAMLESERDTQMVRCDASGAASAKAWPRLGKIEGRRRLWAASSRDDDGNLLEKLEGFYVPEPDRTQDFPLLMDGTLDKSDSSFVDIDDFEKTTPIMLSSDLPTPPPTIVQSTAPTSKDGTTDASFVDIDDFPQEPPPSNQNADSSFLDIDDFPSSIKFPVDPPPGVRTPAASPKKCRGRPPKPHSAIPQTMTASTAPPNKSMANAKGAIEPFRSATLSTPAKKGRFANVEEILDSEDDEALSPTPPRVCRLEDSPPLRLISVSPHKMTLPTSTTQQEDEPIPIFRIPAPQLKWANIHPGVFTAITSHVRSLPPTTNPAHPSWHEKILMYDPIVLEDFTSYLNANTAIRTWRRATLKQVKVWNKVLKVRGVEKMKVNDRDSGHEEESEVLVVKKELEVWMVQKWCEEMSICCVVKEAKAWGRVRRCGG